MSPGRLMESVGMNSRFSPFLELRVQMCHLPPPPVPLLPNEEENKRTGRREPA